MFYHLPISIQWDPETFCDQLRQQGVVATIVRSDIHLTFSSQRCEKYRELLSKQIARRRHAFQRPHGRIRHFPERYLQSLELHIAFLMVPPDEPQLCTVQRSLGDMGAILLDDTDTEKVIAYQNCPNHPAVAEYLQEIERLVNQKKHYIDQMSFEMAAKTRDAEYEARAKLDTLLFHAR